MQHLNFDQQARIFDPALARAVTVLGAGSVGGHVVENLACLGCTDITVWDSDTVASHNIPMSVYRQERDLMELKVKALADIVKTKTGTALTTVPRKYEGEALKTVTIMCVDDMDERMRIWPRARKNALVGLLVDTRVAAEYIEVFAIRTCNDDDVAYYEQFLYPSGKANMPLCGWHGAKHVASTAANVACGSLTEWWRGRIPNRHYRQLCGYVQQV